MSWLRIPKEIFGQMIAQANIQAPIEACGILAGTDSIVEKFYEMTNADNSTDHFMMEPQEQFAVVKDIRANNLQMLAIYHSHPATPARPSREDVRLALTASTIYVILSLQDGNNPVVKGFNIENDKVTQVPVEITEN